MTLTLTALPHHALATALNIIAQQTPLQSDPDAQFTSTSCGINEWIAGDWHRCLFQPITELIGEPTFGVLIGIALYTSLYLAGGGRTTTPTVVVILVATLLFPVLPSGLNGIAWSVLLVGAAASMLQVLQKYVLNPSTT
jgi:hypothetical protein